MYCKIQIFMFFHKLNQTQKRKFGSSKNKFWDRELPHSVNVSWKEERYMLVISCWTMIIFFPLENWKYSYSDRDPCIICLPVLAHGIVFKHIKFDIFLLYTSWHDISSKHSLLLCRETTKFVVVVCPWKDVEEGVLKVSIYYLHPNL